MPVAAGGGATVTFNLLVELYVAVYCATFLARPRLTCLLCPSGE